MESNDFTPDQPPERGNPTDRRPLGFWLRLVDRLITREFRTAFGEEGIDRRDWMLLNAVSGAVDAPWLDAVVARRGKRLRALGERGWLAEIDGRWTLTDEGRAAQARLAELVQGIRAKVSGAVSTDDYATLTASLEAIARELGWDESERMPRGRRFGRGRRAFGPGFSSAYAFGPAYGFGPGFGPAHRHDPRQGHDGDCRGGHRHGFDAEHADGFGPGFDGHRARHGHVDGFAPTQFGPQHRHGHSGRRDERKREHAYERGFEAGFRAAAAGRGGNAPASDADSAA